MKKIARVSKGKGAKPKPAALPQPTAKGIAAWDELMGTVKPAKPKRQQPAAPPPPPPPAVPAALKGFLKPFGLDKPAKRQQPAAPPPPPPQAVVTPEVAAKRTNAALAAWATRRRLNPGKFPTPGQAPAAPPAKRQQPAASSSPTVAQLQAQLAQLQAQLASSSPAAPPAKPASRRRRAS